MMQIIYFTTLYFFLSVNHAYAHGGEELILIKGAEIIAYVSAFVILATSKASKKRKICALGFLLAGILVEIALGFIPYLFNGTLINSASTISTVFATSFSIWICKSPKKLSQKQRANTKTPAILCTAWLITITAIFACIFLAETERKSLDAGIAQLKAGHYEVARQKIESLAQNGNSQAKLLMAEIYTHGLGVDVNIDRAKYWLSCKSIICVEGEAEYKFALLFSNEMFWEGKAVPAPIEPSSFTKYDMNKAIYWMGISSAKGYKNADSWLAEHNKAAKKSQ
ncbi:MAG: sel1 repeat family protein [Alphaproteobacteria bacterium]|nr:sel1 repeat family protein [Alphaproteobacteria bacterium]